MPVSLTTLTGPIYMPNGATPVGGRVSFELSSWDREEGEALIVSGPTYSDIDENGQFSVQLFTTTEGTNTVNYKMYVLWEDSNLAQSYVNDVYVNFPTPHYTKKYIGSFALAGAGPFQISDLNIVSELELNSFDVLLECQAYALAAEDAIAEVGAYADTATGQAAIATAAAAAVAEMVAEVQAMFPSTLVGPSSAFPSRAAAMAATIPLPVFVIWVRHGDLVFAYQRITEHTTLAALDTNGGTVFWVPLSVDGTYDPAAWGDGYAALWNCWEWQKAALGRINMNISQGQTYQQPTIGPVSERRLNSIGIPVKITGNRARLVQNSVEELIGISGGMEYQQSVLAANTVPVPGDDEEGDTFVADIVDLEVADTTGYASGDVIFVRDDESTPLDVDDNPVVDGSGSFVTPGIPSFPIRRRAEHAVVFRVDHDNNIIQLLQPLRFSYNLSAGFRIARMKRTSIDISGLRLDTNTSATQDDARLHLLYIQNAVAPRVENISSHYFGGDVVSFYGCHQPNTSGFTGYWGQDQSVGDVGGRYLIRNTNSGHGIHIGHYCQNARHLIDFLASNSAGQAHLNDAVSANMNGAGTCRVHRITDCIAKGMTSASFSSHDGTEDIVFENCVSESPRNTSFGLRGSGNKIVDCTSINANIDIRGFVHHRYRVSGAAVSRNHLVQGFVSENAKSMVVRTNAGTEGITVRDLEVRYTAEYSGTGALLLRADRETKAVFDGVRISGKFSIDDLVRINEVAAGTRAEITLANVDIVGDPSNQDIQSIVRADGDGEVFYSVRNVRARKGDSGQLIVQRTRGSADIAAGSHVRDSTIFGLWSEDTTAPDRATVLEAYVSSDCDVVRYLDGEDEIPLVRSVGGLAATLADGSQWSGLGPVLSVAAYGASEAAANNGPAFVNALTEAAGRKVIAPAGTYPLTTAIEYTGSVDLDMSKAKLAVNADVRALRLSAEVTGPYTLTSDYTVGSTTLAVAALPAAPVAGQVVWIYSNARDPANRDRGSSTSQFRVAESAIVGEGSTTTSIVLAAPLRFVEGIASASGVGDEAREPSYTTSNAAAVIVPDQSAQCNLKLGEIAYQEGNEATWSRSAVTLRGYVKPRTVGGKILRAYGPGIDLTGTYGAVIDNPDFQHLENNSANGQFGYGVADGGTATRINNPTGGNLRHLVTTSTGSNTTATTDPYVRMAQARSVGGIVSGAHGTGGVNALLDTHADATDYTFQNGRVSGAGGTSATARGRNVVYSGLTIRAGRGRGFDAFTEFSGSDPDDDLHNNGILIDDYTSAVVTDADIEVASWPFECDTATLTMNGRNRGVATSEYIGLQSKGLTFVNGPLDITTAGAGAASGLGLITALAVHSSALGAFPTSRVEINAPTKIDGRAATPALLHGIYGEAGTEVVIRDTLHLILPAGATAWNAAATIRCEGKGEILIEVIGADDSTVATAAAFGARPIRVRTADGTARFDGVRGPERVLWELPAPVTHAGTGAESASAVIDSGGQAFCAAAVTAGTHEKWTMKLRGRRTGSVAGTTQLIIRVGGGTLINNVTIHDAASTATGAWEVEVSAEVTAAGSVAYSIKSAGSTHTSTFAGPVETGLTTPVRLIRVFARAPVGDTITINGAELLGERG